MKLDFAFLADAAQTTPDGKFSVIGGGLNVISVSQFPALHSSLSMLIKLQLTQAETGREHDLRVELLNPLNATAMPPLGAKFTPTVLSSQSDLPVTAQFAITLTGLIFEMPGKYTFRLSVDNLPIGEIPLYTAKQPPATSSLN